MALNPEILAFIDETGDYVLDNFNEQYPIFATCALTCTTEQYVKTAIPALAKVKYRFWGTECVILHGAKIRSRKHPFVNLKNQETADAFMEAVAGAFAELEGFIIAAAIHKPRLLAQYADPQNPFFLSLQFLLERLHMQWGTKVSADRPLLCIFEKRGPEEDKRTATWFHNICGGENHRSETFHFECDFRPKEDNVCGHQFADLAAYTIARYAEAEDKDRKDWKAVSPKIRKNWWGKMDGYGLKIFPPAPKS